MHGFVVAALHGFDLGAEARGLVFGVVELGEAVGDFLAVDEQFEAVGIARFGIRSPRQRRDFHRVLGDEGRLDQGVFDRGLEDFQQQAAPAPGRFELDLQTLAMARQRVAVGAVGNADFRVVVAHRLVHAPTAEGRAQINLHAFPFHLRGAEHFLRGVTDQAFGQVHDLVVGGIGLVQFEHRELGVVPGRHTLVAEVAVDLVDPFQPADHQTLQIQLGRHAQVQIDIQRVVVGDERPRGGAAGDDLHHRRFHFEEAACIQPVADRTHDAAAGNEHRARLGRDDQVDIALAVTLFDIGQPVPLVRQRTQALGQQSQLLRLDRQLAGAGTGQAAGNRDDVADIPALERVVGLAQGVGLEEHLDAAGFVLDLREAGLTHDALGHQPAGEFDLTLQPFQCRRIPAFGIGEFILQIPGEVFAAEIVGEGNALAPDRAQLLAAFGDQLVLVGGRGRGGLVGHGLRAGIRESGLGIRLKSWDSGVGIGDSGKRGVRKISAFTFPESPLPNPCFSHASIRLAPASSPALSAASTNSSRSPSSTFCVSVRSMPVRRSLMRLWSST